MDIQSKYINNIRYYPVYRFFLGMLIIGPVLTPYLRMKGLSYSQVLLLQSVSAAMVVLFEMPTGMVADKVSRKRSLFLSAMCIGVALSLYILFSDFRVFVCAEMIFGIGLTFRSGPTRHCSTKAWIGWVGKMNTPKSKAGPIRLFLLARA
jgi:MFS family permease